MKNEQIPFEKFARIGITKKDFAQMPDLLREAILSGQLTPMLRLRVPAIHGREMEIPMKIQLVYDKNEQLQLLTYQMHRHLDNRLRLNDAELERVRGGEAIQKEFHRGTDRTLRYVQLDKETNCLIYRDVATVKMNKKLQELEKVKDIALGINQRQAATEGKPVELEVGHEKVTVGVDLREPQGFKVVKGDMEEWKRQEAIRYDDANEGYMGYVQTDENRWEYKQVVDKLRHEENVNMTEEQKKKEEKKQGLKM